MYHTILDIGRDGKFVDITKVSDDIHLFCVRKRGNF